MEYVLSTRPNDFLKEVKGVIHVGANTGQERNIYRRFGLNVIWIEPLPGIFKMLTKNLEDFNEQLAYRYLVTDQDDKEYVFHITDNSGESSSIYELGSMSMDIWPTVRHHHDKTFNSITLPSLIKKENIDIDCYNALILDTQGSELLVLKGAESILSKFKYIQSEAADFELYIGCCQVKDLNAYLSLHKFQTMYNFAFARHKDGGLCMDILYKNMAYCRKRSY